MLEGDRIALAPFDRLTDADRAAVLANRTGIIAALEAEHAELTALVRACGNAYRFTPDEHADALRVALSNPAAALACFRAMRYQVLAGIRNQKDLNEDRINSGQSTNLIGECLTGGEDQ